MFYLDCLTGGVPVPDDRAVSRGSGGHEPVFVEVGIVHRDSPGMVHERRLRRDAGAYCVRNGIPDRLWFVRSWNGAVSWELNESRVRRPSM